MNTAREQILKRIRDASGSLPASRESESEGLVREYRTIRTLNLDARLDLLVDRLHDYGAMVYRCAEPGLNQAVASVIAGRAKSALLIPPDLPKTWLPEGFRFRSDRELTYSEMDASEGVLTGCALAIAVTGTIVLRHSSGEGRRTLTLIPDYHLCIVRANQVVETVPEGIREMARFKGVPLTTISGPSATSDIEMTRVQGVHGPRILDVILVE
ncbi:MAG TPA: LUD domain-containing protein [Bryobacteraceae bacterium]|jgi:L-lactate dehydrogenase complex protein LldG